MADERTEINQTMAYASPGSSPDAGISDIVGQTIDDQLADRRPEPALPQDIRRIGRYAVLSKIGEGGMGAVYAAFDEELDRRIAIKVLLKDRSHNRARQRIMREAQAMAKLSHPNVVHVYETGDFEGHIYVAMEYVKGVTLKDWMDDPIHDRDERLKVLLEAGEGLAEAHAAGIIHRDFKPENVMVAEGGRVRVLDFGLARANEDVDGEEEDVSSTVDSAFPERAGSALNDELTQYGAIMGTPMYMSPEQHYGLPTDDASDQFNFCVVLYEVLYGERPYKGEGRVELAYATRQEQILDAPAGSNIPPKWREVILRGLKADPRERHGSMRALLDELQAVAFPPDRKPALIMASLGGVALLLAAILFGVLVFGGPSEEQLSQVDQLEESARVAASRARWVYPAEGTPDDTALRHVMTLRGLEGDLDKSGEERAAELSQEFAGTLARLGDNYWEAEGGKLFARDFYSQALMFDPTLERAKERSGFLPAEIADLRERAKTGEFSPEEIAAAEELAELAEPLIDPEAAPPPAAALAEKVEKVKKKARKRRKRHTSGEPDVVAVADTPPVVEDPLDGGGEAGGDETGGDETGGDETGGDETGLADELLAIPPEEMDREQARAAAKALVAEAKKLKRKGRRDAALKKAYQATKLDRRYAPAWDLLRDLHFQVGAYQEAANYGEKAVKNASRNGKYHLRLGEAYWKLHDYDQAEAAWKKAQSLGVDQATTRLQALRKKLGR